jgi:ABC-2 type transport system permease protein
MMTGGRRSRARIVAAALLLFAAFMHLLAFILAGPFAHVGSDPGTPTLVLVTGTALLSWTLMLSQAMEMVTRAFYARADLDLILASPVSARKVFAIRIAAIAASTSLMAVPMAGAFINVLAWLGGPHWLAAYGVILAMGAAATAVAVALTVTLFATLGPKRTRLVSQIVAAVVGAGFVIGVQIAAIVSTGEISRFAVFRSLAVLSHAPNLHSPFWWPARAVLGNLPALALVLLVSLALLLASIAVFSMRFADLAAAAAGISTQRALSRSRPRGFQHATPAQTLRRKEWVLLRRDPWLVSQTLLQVFYLLPPALMLWRNFRNDGGALTVLIPICVMASGQLAGGLAWLAVSGEDAPDLVASAPVRGDRVLRAKIEAVMGCVALVMAPFLIAFALMSLLDALIAVVGIVVAAGSATLIQLWFRTQAKRTQFRRRQTSSRMATFAEAFSSITWAATAGLAAAGTWMAIIPGGAAFLILAGTGAIRPR